MNEAKILFIDIETAPNTAYVWGLFQQNISPAHVEVSSYILCWSAKWLGQEKAYFGSAQHTEVRPMLEPVHDMLEKADVVVHYNGTSFDVPVLNREFLKCHLPPPSPYKQVDLLRVCRKAFRFESNKLDSVLKALGLGQKMEHRGFQLWVGCMKGDPACWAEMGKYNRHDVVQTEKLYKRILPWIDQHPKLSVYSGTNTCDKCGSRAIQRRGIAIARTKRYQRYQCQSCGGWSTGKVAIPSEVKK